MVTTPANSLDITSAGLVKFDGTSAFSGVTVTQHDLLVGGASNGITSVAPSATSGVPVISQGASADPTFGTVVVAGGGTGLTSATAYMPLCGGTTTTGNFQSVATGTAGYVLTYQSSSALPTWTNAGSLVLLSTQTPSGVASVVFTSLITSTYKTYILQLSEIVASSGTPTIQITLSTDNGGSYLASGYSGGQTYNQTSTTNTWNNANSTSVITLGSTGTTNGPCATIFLGGLLSGSNPQIYGFGCDSGTLNMIACSQSNANINAIKVALSSGNISGTVSLWGLTG